MILSLPLRTVNGANSREHWAARAKRAKRERGVVRLAWGKRATALPCRVHLIRVGPRRMDYDGLVISLKHVRDGVADCLGVDDADPRIEWAYSQTSGRYGVIIQVEAGAGVGG